MTQLENLSSSAGSWFKLSVMDFSHSCANWQAAVNKISPSDLKNPPLLPCCWERYIGELMQAYATCDILRRYLKHFFSEHVNCVVNVLGIVAHLQDTRIRIHLRKDTFIAQPRNKASLS